MADEARNIIRKAQQASRLNALSPEGFVEVTASTIPALADEYRYVTVTVSREKAPRFCADLRRGIAHRLQEDRKRKTTGHSEGRARQADLDLPDDIEKACTRAPSVAIRLPADAARLLAMDLSTGIGLRRGGLTRGPVSPPDPGQPPGSGPH